jgi:NADPH:quinone reductase-like Zn-dependent oxidoreductase
MMKAAIVRQFGATPVYGDFEAPMAAAGEVRVTVTASALSQLTRGRASGSHYSSSGGLPFVAGVDGVGRLDDGRRVYFVLPRAPFGGMGEQTVVPTVHCIPVPDEVDDLTAAAIPNPGMSSWAALTERARIVAGETVLINGATGTSGRLAVQIARHLGAKRVIATGRNTTVLAELATLGADMTIALSDDPSVNESAFREAFAGRVDVVLDYLWGPSAERLLVSAAKSGAEGAPIRFVNIGTMSGPDITLPGAVLRASALLLMGSGLGSVPFDRLLNAIAALLAAIVPAGLRIETRSVPLSDVEQTWTAPGTAARTVFRIG